MLKRSLRLLFASICLTALAPGLSPAGTANAQMSPEEALRRLRESETQRTPRPTQQVPTITDEQWESVSEGVIFYLHVPITGEIGSEVTANGVRLALEGAATQELIQHVVFYLDSQGGMVAEADDILRTIQEYDSRFEFHAVVKHAISAAIWIAFACDTIHMTDGGSIGGAVIYSGSSTGVVQVDEKINSVILARVVSAAESKGHPGQLVRCMIVQSEEVFTSVDNDNGRTFSSSRPAGDSTASIQTLDDAESVLTLTAKQAVELGLAEHVDSSLDNLGDVLDLRRLTKANDWGAHAMGYGYWLKRLHGDVQDFRRIVDTRRSSDSIDAHNAVAGMYNGVNTASKHDPERAVRLVDQRGTTHLASERDWRIGNYRCRQAWTKVRRHAAALYGDEQAKLTVVNDIRRLAQDEIDRINRVNVHGFPKTE